ALRGVVYMATMLGRPAAVHVEIDTGMGRAGVPWRDVVVDPAPLRKALDDARRAGVRWEGCFTHFHSADEPGGPGVQEQAARLLQVLDSLGAPPAGPDFQ